MVYIGTYNSGAAKISMPILNKAHLLMISPANTWPGLTKPDKGDPGEPAIYQPDRRASITCGWCPTDDLQGPLGAAWAKEMGVKRVYVLDDNEVYGKGIATLFIEACQDLGIEVLGHESIDSKAQEFKPLMATIKGEKPDLVYFGGTTQSKGGQIAKDMVAAGLDCKLMVPDACYEEAFIQSAGAENVNDRCYVTFGGLPPERAARARARRSSRNTQRATAASPRAMRSTATRRPRWPWRPSRAPGVKDREAIRRGLPGDQGFRPGRAGHLVVRRQRRHHAQDDQRQHRSQRTSSNSSSCSANRRAACCTASRRRCTAVDGGRRRDVASAAGRRPTRPSGWQTFLQYALIGLTNGALFALIALGYTMVYGIIELINFAHGDVFMLGSFLALALIGALGLEDAEPAAAVAGHWRLLLSWCRCFARC